MSLITWSNDLSVGVPAMDCQHQKLVKMINDLCDAMSEGRGRDIISSVLNEMITYTDTHFIDEEKLMQDAGFGDFSSHKKIHDDFRRKALDLQKDYESGNGMISIDVMEFLSDWLIDHIKGADKEYSSLLAPALS